MSIFDTEDKIDCNWLIDKGFCVLRENLYNECQFFTKVLRTHNPFVYININIVTFEVALYWRDINKYTDDKHALYMGVITDKIQMSSIMYKYSQENCLY